MAEVINYCDTDIHVVGKDLATGKMIAWRLKPGQATNPEKFTTSAVRMFFPYIKIFGFSSWWDLSTGIKVFVHKWFSTITLQCVPADKSGLPSYSHATRITRAMYDTVPFNEQLDLSLTPSTGLNEEFDGEYDSHFLGTGGGSWVGWVRAGEYVNVRIRLIPDDVSLATVDSLKAGWKSQIETIWNPTTPPLVPANFEKEIKFQVEWVDDFQHHTVSIGNYKHPSGKPKFSADSWAAVPSSSSFSFAHEFGHLLGMQDEYMFMGELPYVANKKGYVPKKEWPWEVLSIKSYAFLQKSRAKKRMDLECTQLNIMNNQSIRLNMVDQKLIDAFHTRQMQELCYADPQFCVKWQRLNRLYNKQQINFPKPSFC